MLPLEPMPSDPWRRRSRLPWWLAIGAALLLILGWQSCDPAYGVPCRFPSRPSSLGDGLAGRADEERVTLDDSASGDNEPGCDVLLVEDDEDLRRAMRALLEDVGYRVQVAEDVLSAEEQMRRWRPEVVLVDLHLARVPGPEVARWARGVAGSTLPVAVLSGDTVDGPRTARWIGAEFIGKPAKLAELIALIEDLRRRSPA